MTTSQPTGLDKLRAYAERVQEARTSRRALIKSAAVGASAAAAVALPGSVGAAPGTASGDAPLELAQGLAPNTALVVSPRLPLKGIGKNQIAPLLLGDITNWADVGVPMSLPVKLYAIAPDYIPDGSSPEKVNDYNALTEKLDQNPGGFAMLPLEVIDVRVSVLDIDGVNPLLALSTEADPIIKIGVAGDIIFGRNGGNRQRTYGDYNLPMYQVKDFLSTFDVTTANFECFVSETIEPPEITNPNTLDFVTPPDSLQGMVMGGFDSVTMANNHAVWANAGYGIPGMQDTMKYLNAANIAPFGVGMTLDEARAPWVTTVNGKTIAIYGIDGVTANLEFPHSPGVQQHNDNDRTSVPVDARASSGGTNPLKFDINLKDIEDFAGQYDIVLPFLHVGDQYVWSPRDWVVETCRKLIDAGASAVLTAHPHATMGMEIYKGKCIWFNFGNFIYDQMFSVETRQGYFCEMIFKGNTLVNFRIHPSECQDFVQPRFMSPLESASFNDRFWRSVDLVRKQYGYTPNPS